MPVFTDAGREAGYAKAWACKGLGSWRDQWKLDGETKAEQKGAWGKLFIQNCSIITWLLYTEAHKKDRDLSALCRVSHHPPPCHPTQDLHPCASLCRDPIISGNIPSKTSKR